MIRSEVTACFVLATLAGSVAWAAEETNSSAPRPFIRDVETGYLLNCFFLSPRPYSWGQKETVRLSGWEVDKTGGYFDYQPNCEYPQGFAFHSDWFKLVDTSPNSAITLKHQIARQTDGELTLEFRFKLPKLMEGVCWQLRDLEQAGVSLITRSGNLCWESGQVITPIEPDRDYGVKVVADLAAKTADVFVDGELKAKECAFLRPIQSVDFFLVKSGDADIGEMYLNPVNLYRGYILNETFVTCAPGKIPAGWELRDARIEKFECGTKPDILSLKVTGEASLKTGTCEGKTVLECRFLLPHSADGVAIDLGGIHLEKLVSYRPNLWYTAKVVADPKARTADVYLNGKLLPQKPAFPDGSGSLRYTGDLWVDDLRIYPWRDYPADYVPEPKPVKAEMLLGVQSCNLWREGTAYAGWDYVYPYRDKRQPFLGWYEEGNPEETDWEIKWKVEHGIGFEQHCWYRPNNAVNQPIKDGVLDHALIRGLFQARYSHLAKFTIMFTNEGAGATNPGDWRDNIIPYWIEYFFKDPRYLAIGGRPVISIYSPRNFQTTFGGTSGAQQAILTLRDEVAKAGFPGIIVLMEERSGEAGNLGLIKELGADACYAYTWGAANSQLQRDKNLRQRAAADSVGLGMLPSISMGWDREAWGVHDGFWLAPQEYRSLARWAKDEFMPGFAADSLGRRIVMLANWNEFGEGHFLQPSTLAGFGYLDALREVFAGGGAHEDAQPTAEQKRRFTTLFPRD
jgi:hypothetical protein